MAECLMCGAIIPPGEKLCGECKKINDWLVDGATEGRQMLHEESDCRCGGGGCVYCSPGYFGLRAEG